MPSQEPFEVEAGGTLTFKNSNGDGFQIPVPSRGRIHCIAGRSGRCNGVTEMQEKMMKKLGLSPEDFEPVD